MKFLEDMTPQEREEYIEERKKKVEEDNMKYIFFNNIDTYRYRGEQTVSMKINNIPVSNIITKTDYSLKSQIENRQLTISVNVDENHIKAFPPSSQGALELMDNIETIYSNIKVAIDPANGKVRNIIHYDDLLERWKDYKISMTDKYAFLREKQAKAALKDLIRNIEDYLLYEDRFIRQLGSKMFFFVFFDKYLVSQEDFSTYKQDYYSYLFDNSKTPLEVKQQILGEESERIKINRSSNLTYKAGENKKIEEIYNQKYKPLAGYDFSEYNIGYSMEYILNTTGNYYENAELAITEEVNNNIELAISYKLRKIK